MAHLKQRLLVEIKIGGIVGLVGIVLVDEIERVLGQCVQILAIVDYFDHHTKPLVGSQQNLMEEVISRRCASQVLEHWDALLHILRHALRVLNTTV